MGASATAPDARAASLPDDVAALKAIIAQRDGAIAQRDELIAEQRHRIEVLNRIAFGPQSERRACDSLQPEAFGQLSLFYADILAEAERTAREKQVQGEVVTGPPKAARKKGGRRNQFPDHLPRIETRYELQEDARCCGNCGGALHEIGEERTRELERLETSIVHEIRRAKYACRGCTDGVTTAPGPDRVIDKGILGPGFLAHVATERFGSHMPYNRLEKKYASEGLDLSRSVLERSMARCAELLAPIAARLREEILAEPTLFTDDTPVTIAKPKGQVGSKQGRVWIYLDRNGRHSYDFTDSRKRDGPLAVMGDYRGAVHADAYPGYDSLFLPNGATEVACWAHARRKFVEAEKTEPDLATEAVDRIRALYAIEREAKKRELDDDARRALRQERSAVLVDDLFAWMAKTEQAVLPKGPMGRALAYALKLEVALRRFLDDGRLEMDNNAAERALRAVAVGRKNWMFFQTEGGGETAVVMLSLVMTAKAAGVDPRTYLRDVLLRIARESDVAKLTPHGWKEHFQAEVEEERRAAMGALLGS
jgi:transposase